MQIRRLPKLMRGQELILIVEQLRLNHQLAPPSMPRSQIIFPSAFAVTAAAIVDLHQVLDVLFALHYAISMLAPPADFALPFV